MAAEQLDERRAIFVISGTQGAGKTTVSSILAWRFARGAHVSADMLQKMIVSGGEWPGAGEPNINTAVAETNVVRQLRLRLHNACLLARSFYDANFTAVVDDIIVGARTQQLRDELADIPFHFVTLVPSLAAVREREAGRNTNLWREWEWLSKEFANTQTRDGLWLDTSEQTAEQTVDEIMARAWNEAIIMPETATARSAR